LPGERVDHPLKLALLGRNIIFLAPLLAGCCASSDLPAIIRRRMARIWADRRRPNCVAPQGTLVSLRPSWRGLNLSRSECISAAPHDGRSDTSVTLRRTQFRAADDPARCVAIARRIIAADPELAQQPAKTGAENGCSFRAEPASRVIDALARQIQNLADSVAAATVPQLDALTWF